MAAPTASILRSRVSLVWLVMVVATIVSWTIGTEHGLHARLATTIILFVALTKVRFICMYFMELRHAPIQLRGIVEGYCLLVAAALIAMYLANA
jgi:cytochrome c oxidase subunit IV